MKNFVISISQEDAKQACINYAKKVKSETRLERLDYIHNLLHPRPPTWFGLIKHKPQCASVKEAIKHLKATPAGLYSSTTLWNYIYHSHYRCDTATTCRKLLAAICRDGIIGDIKLDSTLSFLTKYVKPIK